MGERAMSKKESKAFGPTLRRERMKRKIPLRQFARQVEISPTYLSKIEREEFPPPSEAKVVTIADLLGQDRDEWLALAGRVSSDLKEIIREHPRELANFLRGTLGMSDDERAEALKLVAEKMKARNIPDYDYDK